MKRFEWFKKVEGYSILYSCAQCATVVLDLTSIVTQKKYTVDLNARHLKNLIINFDLSTNHFFRGDVAI